MKHYNLFAVYFFSVLLLFSCEKEETKQEQTQSLIVDISNEHPFYFAINGKPTLLLGGSNDDNIFQIHPLEPQLDTIVKFGGNYIRCTLSSRDFANQWPYKQRGDALYDLNEFSEEYWSRLEKFFKLSAEKGLIVQLEIWDNMDFYTVSKCWSKHPFNPAYNVNYTQEDSKLEEDINYLPTEKIQAFFTTVPELDNNTVVLPYQQQFVDKLLSHSFKYDNILYSIDNESLNDIKWTAYWAKYIKAAAAKINKKVLITDMLYDNKDFEKAKAMVVNTSNTLNENPRAIELSNYPETIDFIDLSAQSILSGEEHYIEALNVHNQLNANKHPMPISAIKTYGGEQSDWTGTIEDGPERFWRSIFAGYAAARFHRPPSGLGINRLAQVNIKSLRMLSDSVDFFNMSPANDLLDERQPNETYCLANKSLDEFILYYPGCGEVDLKLGDFKGEASIKWVNILNSSWDESYTEKVSEKLWLKSPCEGKWAVWVKLIK